MKLIFLTICFLIVTEIHGQYRSGETVTYSFEQPIFPAAQKTFIPNLLADPIKNYRISSPSMINFSSLNWRMQNDFFWGGTITTMSYNKGKFGTLFYWDVQGNLRGTKGFIDISGKNKQGFKLVFPWQQLIRSNTKF